jgi:hypothetical protein
MFLNRLLSQLFSTLTFLTILSGIVHSEEKPEHQLESVLKKWSDAAAKIETIDAKVKQWSYNNTWKAVDCREGRVYFEKSGNCSFKTDSVTDKATREEQKKDGFELLDPTTRHFVWFDNKCSIIDHKKEHVSTYGLERAESVRLEVKRIKNEGTFWEKLTCFGTGFIDLLSSPKNHLLPVLLENDVSLLQQRFEFKILTKPKLEEICLSATPKHDDDKANFDRIDILIDSRTNLPTAVQVIARGGKERNVSQLQEMHLNEKPTDCEELLQPKLDGYRCHEEK